jgi:ribonuclease Z
MVPFYVTILGSSSAIPTPIRFTTSQVVNHNNRLFMIDCGEAAQIQMRRFDIKSGRINHIFISHLHGDHIFGLPGLISSMKMGGKKGELHIHAHSEMQKVLSTLMKFMNESVELKIIYHELNNRRHSVLFEDEKIRIESFPLKHRIPCCGFIFREQTQELHLRGDKIQELNISIRDRLAIKKGGDYTLPDGTVIPNRELTLIPVKPRSYAFCTDTVVREKIIPYIEGVDLLYHEATFGDDLKELAQLTGHTTARQAAELAIKASVGKLIIGHFSTRYKDINLLVNEAREVFPNTYATNDGEKFDIRDIDHISSNNQ